MPYRDHSPRRQYFSSETLNTPTNRLKVLVPTSTLGSLLYHRIYEKDAVAAKRIIVNHLWVEFRQRAASRL